MQIEAQDIQLGDLVLFEEFEDYYDDELDEYQCHVLLWQGMVTDWPSRHFGIRQLSIHADNGGTWLYPEELVTLVEGPLNRTQHNAYRA